MIFMKFKELRGIPFEAESEYLYRIDKDNYIAAYKLKLNIKDNIYETVINLEKIKEKDMQLYINRDWQTLMVNLNTDKKELEKVHNEVTALLRETGIEFEKLSVKEYAALMNEKINNKKERLEDFNSATDKANYKETHLKINEKYFAFVRLREYPPVLNVKELLDIADISIKVLFKEEEKTEQVKDILLETYQKQQEKAQKRVELTPNNPIYPYRLKERIKALENLTGYNTMGLEIEFLLEAETEERLKEKIEKIEKVKEFNADLLVSFMNKDFLIRYLPVCYDKEYTIAFYGEDENGLNVKFFENIKLEKDKVSLLDKIQENKIAKEILKFFNINLTKGRKGLIFRELYENGMVELNDGTFSSIYEFTNVNYALESEETKINILRAYQNYLNVISENIKTQLYIINKRKNIDKLREELFLKDNEKYQVYINEYNSYLNEKIIEAYENCADTRYFIIVNTVANTVEEAEMENRRIFEDIKQEFNSFSSQVKKLGADEVLEVLYSSLMQADKDREFLASKYDYQAPADLQVMPSTLKVDTDVIRTTNGYKKIFYVKKYPSDMSDHFINSLIRLPFNLEITLHIETLNIDKAFKKINNKILAMENEKRERAKKDQGTGYVPYKLESDLMEGYYILEKINNDDQKLFLTTFYVAIFAETKEELKTREKILKNTFAKELFDYNSVFLRQLEGFYSILPLANNRLKKLDRALLTENITFLHPFNYLNIRHKNGMFYGLSDNKSPLVIDRKRYNNTSAFIFGTPGSGKSFFTKLDIVDTYFNSDDHIIIIDPEREFGALVEALGGEVIVLSTSTDNYINIMKLPENTDLTFDEEVKEKIEFIITFLEKLTGDILSAAEKSILDRCLRKIYQEYRYKNEEPVLKDLQDMLRKQEEDVAKELILKLEIYTEGSLDIFAKKTNVNINNRLVVFDIKDLREQLKPAALTAVLDAIWDRMNENREKGIFTRLYIDEFYILARNENSSEWLFEAWKRVRKYRGIPTGITQNIGDLMENHQVASMLANSEIQIIFNQREQDRQLLAEKFGLSEEQIDKIRDGQAGTGLVIAGNDVFSFDNRLNPDRIPNLYKLISTSHKE